MSTCHFKLVLLGETAVGKSCLVVRFVRDEFFEFQEPTIGAAFLTQTVPLDTSIVKFEIWDTAGQGALRERGEAGRWRCACSIGVAPSRVCAFAYCAHCARCFAHSSAAGPLRASICLCHRAHASHLSLPPLHAHLPSPPCALPPPSPLLLPSPLHQSGIAAWHQCTIEEQKRRLSFMILQRRCVGSR